jgi:hypothetical protein
MRELSQPRSISAQQMAEPKGYHSPSGTKIWLSLVFDRILKQYLGCEIPVSRKRSD